MNTCDTHVNWGEDKMQQRGVQEGDVTEEAVHKIVSVIRGGGGATVGGG